MAPALSLVSVRPEEEGGGGATRVSGCLQLTKPTPTLMTTLNSGYGPPDRAGICPTRLFPHVAFVFCCCHTHFFFSFFPLLSSFTWRQKVIKREDKSPLSPTSLRSIALVLREQLVSLLLQRCSCRSRPLSWPNTSASRRRRRRHSGPWAMLP